jgi:uncharacterized membrane-anchored protein
MKASRGATSALIDLHADNAADAERLPAIKMKHGKLPNHSTQGAALARSLAPASRSTRATRFFGNGSLAIDP